MARTDFKSIDAYIEAQPERVQEILRQMRRVIRQAVPEVEETISYQIPAFKLAGKSAIYFAGWKEHVSLYPLTEAVVARFGRKLERYKVSKGTIRFPLSEPLPLRLIADIARTRARETAETGEAGSARRKDGKAAAASAAPSSRVKRARNPMPDDVETAIAGRKLTAAWHARPEYQRNDYLGWIAAAKRPETRERRLAQMLGELERGGVYMKMAWKG
jgi:uncharacterized protein YdhG (YjbR/CyaY superfamily)